jgi:RNA polymerase sigma factor (sigma-70 family)
VYDSILEPPPKEAERTKFLISLDECLLETEDEITLKDTLPGDEDHPPEASAERAKLSKDVDSMLSVLTRKQRYVIERRYGLAGGKRMTLDQIADELHISKTAVHSTQEKALRKLRANKEVFQIAQDFLGLLTKANSISDESRAEPRREAENQE